MFHRRRGIGINPWASNYGINPGPFPPPITNDTIAMWRKRRRRKHRGGLYIKRTKKQYGRGVFKGKKRQRGGAFGLGAALGFGLPMIMNLLGRNKKLGF